jgi:hypothetical protein
MVHVGALEGAFEGARVGVELEAVTTSVYTMTNIYL